MARGKLIRRLRRPARDFLVGLGLIAVVAASGVADRGPVHGIFAHSAHAGWEAEDVAAAAGLGERATAPAVRDQTRAYPLELGILAVALSGMMAFNMWFARHLRRVAASRGRGRGERSPDAGDH